MSERRIVSLALGLLVVAFFYSNIPSENLAGSAVWGGAADEYFTFEQIGCEFEIAFNKFPVNPGRNTIRYNHVKVAGDTLWLHHFDPEPWDLDARVRIIKGNVISEMKPFGAVRKVHHALDRFKHMGSVAVAKINFMDFKSESGMVTIEKALVVKPCV